MDARACLLIRASLGLELHQDGSGPGLVDHLRCATCYGYADHRSLRLRHCAPAACAGQGRCFIADALAHGGPTREGRSKAPARNGSLGLPSRPEAKLLPSRFAARRATSKQARPGANRVGRDGLDGGRDDGPAGTSRVPIPETAGRRTFCRTSLLEGRWLLRRP